MFFEQYSHEPNFAVARFWLAFSPKEELEKRRHFLSAWHTKGNAAHGVMQTHLAWAKTPPLARVMSGGGMIMLLAGIVDWFV